MARGVNLTSACFISIGGSSYLSGSDNDDNINVRTNINSGYFSSTEIKLFDGNDNVWVGGYMTGRGTNIISGGNGNKNINVNRGMDAWSGAENIINLQGVQGDRHNITIGLTRAGNNGQNRIITQEGTDNLVFTNSFRADNLGINSIELGTGTKYITFRQDFSAYKDGANSVHLGIGSHNIVISSSLTSYYLGKNDIVSDGGDTNLSAQSLIADGNNTISLGDGYHTLNFGRIYAGARGHNLIKTDGTTQLTVNSDILSHQSNEILTGAGDDSIIVRGGLHAYTGSNIIDTGAGNDSIIINQYLKASYGDNLILTGDGDDSVYIGGYIGGYIGSTISAGIYNINYINTGNGNDVVTLDASVGVRSLSIDAGNGYDTLKLVANDFRTFDYRYKGWLSDISKTNSLGATGLEQIDVEIARSYSLKQIDWLTNIINNYNANNDDSPIHVSVNLNNWSSAFRLSDVFTSANEQAIDMINLSGNKANKLTINNTLASNGYDNNILHVNGDSNDSVEFNSVWTKTGTDVVDEHTGIAYNVYHNSNNEDVYVQAGMNVINT